MLTHAFLLVLAAGFPQEGKQAPVPDLKELARKGKEIREALRKGPANWQVVHYMTTGAVVTVDVTSEGKNRRTRITFEALGRRDELLDLLERDGAWYVTDAHLRGKYRPYEAPVSFPTAYGYLTSAELSYLEDPEILKTGRFAGVTKGKAEWVFPLPESTRGLLEGMVRNSRELEKRAEPEEWKKLAVGLQGMRLMLKEGLPLSIDLDTGLVVQRGSFGQLTRLKSIEFLKEVPQGTFDPGEKPWKETLSDPTAGDRRNLVMIQNMSQWRAGMKTPEMNLCLMDLRTGAFRRIPYRGSSAFGGSFSPDRKRVYVSGLIPGGLLQIVEIDLVSGRNRVLAENLPKGMYMKPTTSPDGKTLSAGYGSSNPKGGVESLLRTRVALVDVETGEGRFIGPRMDAAYLSWHPSGKKLVFVRRRTVDPEKPSVGTVSTIDLDGRITALFPGKAPVLIRQGTRVLYEDQKDGLLYTRALDGTGEKKLGNGFAKHSFLAPNREGSHVVMMRFPPGVSPQPVLLDLETLEVRRITWDPGLWAMPRWR